MTDTTTPAAAAIEAVVEPGAQLQRLRRMQWTLRGALAVALIASMAANVLHAAPDPVARSIAAWSPLALYAAIEVMTRVPIRNRLLGGIRIVATVAIAIIAGITSYLHMVGVAERYGESWQVVYLLPISVDGIVAVFTLSLLDIASQVRAITTTPPPAPQQQTDALPTMATPPGSLQPTNASIGRAVIPGHDRADAATSRSTVRSLEAGAQGKRVSQRPVCRPIQPDRPPAITGMSRDAAASLPIDLQPLLEPAAHTYQ
ncbi:DUF2637 domain-containing protein [Dactylosporangium sp. NPDC000521]|uniref:DUF2637 domain-containing protein n=1 Tax=Dactylosporangium sp. NPDC000521 TaxID=3363975 RepID=UPI00367A5163